MHRLNGKQLPKVFVITSHGRQELDSVSDDKLIDILMKNQVPWSAVSVYRSNGKGNKLTLCSGLDKKVSDFNAEELLLYFNRNVNPFKFSINHFRTVQGINNDDESTEYLYQHLKNDDSSVSTYLKKMNSEECKEIIATRVADIITTHLPKGSHIVVGVSGGGDSNALLHGLSKLGDEYNVYPVIIKGIPDWDKGVPRAIELCRRYNLNLRILEEEEVKGLLGIPEDGQSLIERYERNFPGDDFEFLGTLLIRLALTKCAREIGTRYICTGLNLEDVLCENIFRVSNGLKPSSIPARVIGDMTLIYPLWLCPKKIIDGCFPKYSLDNYDARYPCFSLGRNLYYSIIYSIQSSYPGFAEQLAKGFSLLSSRDPVIYNLDEELGFYVERMVPLDLRHKFHQMLKGSTGITLDNQ